jgi:hypothetical protein
LCIAKSLSTFATRRMNTSLTVEYENSLQIIKRGHMMVLITNKTVRTNIQRNGSVSESSNDSYTAYSDIIQYRLQTRIVIGEGKLEFAPPLPWTKAKDRMNTGIHSQQLHSSISNGCLTNSSYSSTGRSLTNATAISITGWAWSGGNVRSNFMGL